jgi:hypothetical protein
MFLIIEWLPEDYTPLRPKANGGVLKNTTGSGDLHLRVRGIFGFMMGFGG